MIQSIIPLLGTFLGSGIWEFAFIPIICLAFIALVPALIWFVVRR